MRQMMTIIGLQVKPGSYMESQSGLARNDPRIYCRYERPFDRQRSLAFVLVHPTSNFHAHYLVEPLVASGAAVLAVNTRYVGNDTMLIMERAAQDLGVALQFLRSEGYRKIVLIGNSGGGSLASFYQYQAQVRPVDSTPDGLPFSLEAGEMPQADAIALVAAHPGRASQLLAKLDPSLRSENDLSNFDSTLDMFNPANGPPYQPAWLAQFRAAQVARMQRIESYVTHRLAALAGAHDDAGDEAFVIHRTQADPRNLDLSLDRNDRAIGTLGGHAQAYNAAANGLARFCTLRSFLSQWSPAATRADGPRCLAETTMPVLIIEYTADQTVFPSHTASWRQAAGGRATFCAIKRALHYPIDQQGAVENVSRALLDWSFDFPVNPRDRTELYS